MSIHEHEEWEREMMNDYYFQPSTAFDQAAAFRQEDHRLDTVEPMDTINHMEWWPDQDGLPMGFDPVDGSVAAEPAIASPYQPFGDPLISSTSDTPTARDYDYSMYDYGDGYDEQGGVEESGESTLPTRHPRQGKEGGGKGKGRGRRSVGGRG